MKKFTASVFTLFALATLAMGADLFTIAPAQKEQSPVAPAPVPVAFHVEPADAAHCKDCASGGYLTLTYAEGYRKAVALDKPLLVWVGGNFCERCVEDSKDEFVHVFVDKWGADGDDFVVAPAQIIAVPRGSELVKVAVVKRWVTGDAVFGHTSTARRILRDFRRGASVVALHAWSLGFNTYQGGGGGYGGGMKRGGGILRGGRGGC